MATLRKDHIFNDDGFDEFIRTVRSFDLVHDSDLTLFRGQACAEWHLEPRIVRQKINSLFNSSEAKLLDEFQRLGRSFISPDIISNRWDFLAFAQHYGLKTRLLDWTTNPLVALWFAFIEESKCEFRAVWILLLDESDIASTTDGSPLDQQRTLAFKPNHVTPRITAQHGWFTTHKYVPRKENFVPLDTNVRYVEKLYKVNIPNDSRDEILIALDKFGINAASIYSDLYGLTQYLNWKHKPL